jgi:cardiolipin synthase
MDYWSLLNDDEVNAVVLGREFAAEMEEAFAKDLVASHQIKWEEWRERSVFSKMREGFAHMVAHWL